MYISDDVEIALSTQGLRNIYLFRDGGPYHIETSPLICSVNQWAGFYLVGISVMKELLIAGVRKIQRCNQSSSNIHNGTFEKKSKQH